MALHSHVFKQAPKILLQIIPITHLAHISTAATLGKNTSMLSPKLMEEPPNRFSGIASRGRVLSFICEDPGHSSTVNNPAMASKSSRILPLAFKGLYNLCLVLRCHDLSSTHPSSISHFPFTTREVPVFGKSISVVHLPFYNCAFDSELSIKPYAIAETAEMPHTLFSFLLRQRYDSCVTKNTSLQKPLFNPSQHLICSLGS